MRLTTAICLAAGGVLFLGADWAGIRPALAQEAAPQEPPAPYQWMGSSGVSVLSGDYGTGDNTTITQISQTVKVRGTGGEVGVTVPYLFRSGGAVTPGEGGRARNASVPNDSNGLGDVQLKGKAFWLEETNSRPQVDWDARLKIPTASEEDGLGTGGVDFGFGPELTKWVGSWMFFGNLEGILRDTPSDSTLKSTRIDYGAGIGYLFNERWLGTLSLEGGTPTNSGSDAPLEIVLASNYRMTSAVDANVFVLAGLTDGSPDVGAGVSLRYKF